MTTVRSKLLPLAAAAILATLCGPVLAESYNENLTIQEGLYNLNDTRQRGDINDNRTYQEGRENLNRTRQRGIDNRNATGQFGKYNWNKTIQEERRAKRQGRKRSRYDG